MFAADREGNRAGRDIEQIAGHFGVFQHEIRIANVVGRHEHLPEHPVVIYVQAEWIESSRRIGVEQCHAQGVVIDDAAKPLHPVIVAVTEASSPVPGLSFTQDGLQPLLTSARTNYLLAEISSACGQKEEADRKYRLSAQATDTSDALWAWASAKKLGSYDPALWRERLSSALSKAESNTLTSANQGWWAYLVGVLQMALGNEVQGKASLRESLLLPDNRMSYHFSRLAMEGATPR